jgi:predicted flap endonuclease-1-like 5' DNA nuclease
MPEISVIHIVFLAVALIAGLAAGWVFRGRQAGEEKAAISAGWHEQLQAQRQEHERLVAQNRDLMEQNSQYQASNRDSKMRAAELSAALKEAFERRDRLQRQIKDIRGNLAVAVVEREQLQSDMRHHDAETEATAEALKRRDDRIAWLTKELENWQARVPPLVEKFRERNELALQLEGELATARERIEALESMIGSDETRVEPLDREALGQDLDACNEPIDAESADSGGGDMAAAPSAVPGDDAAAADCARDSAPDPGSDGLEEADDRRDRDDGSDLDARADTAGSDDGANLGDQVLSPEGRDDLKMIKGVGPAIEKTLNEMGIRNFEQIAAMSEYDIDRIARRLKGFRTRIYREDWIGQARDLRDQKSSRRA